jgi:hypothetical protein
MNSTVLWICVSLWVNDNICITVQLWHTITTTSMEIKLPKYQPIPRADQLNQITYKQATLEFYD